MYSKIWFPEFLVNILIGLLIAGLSDSCCRAQSPTAQLSFQVATGLKIQPVATDPLVKWPTVVDWDDQGNLLVVESAGVAKPIQQHNQQLLHRIVRLVDEDGDGVMDQRMVVADQLPFMEGVLCLGNDLLVAAPPYIWKLMDHDGDGKYENREIWFDGQTITGCANDLHGPFLGRDGWVYWCKGAFAEQTHPLTNGQTLKDKAAHIFRRHRSGGPIEPVMSGGMDNPVEMAVLPNGERFFSSTFLLHPGDGRRDGIVHAIYGGAYGKDHAALDGVVRTGALMPVMTHLGPAAPSGLIALESTMLLDQQEPTLVAALFNLQKVVALPLQADGSTYQSQPKDLVVGSRIDFHPTDIIEDSDGSLLIVDTGGWYDLCCPSSRVDQQTASGGIYRLTTEAAKPQENSRKVVIAWDNLTANQTVELLDAAQPWIARTALLRIADSKDSAMVEALNQRLVDSKLSIRSRQNALWALGAIGSEEALQHIINQLLTNDIRDLKVKPLQHISSHLLSLHRYQAAGPVMEAILILACSRQPAEVDLARVTIESLGRLGGADTASLILELCGVLPLDRTLDHSVRYALYEIAQPDSVSKFLTAPKAVQKDIALGTLGLLQAKQYLTADHLVTLAGDPELVGTAAELLGRQPHLATEALSIAGSEWLETKDHQPPGQLFKTLSRSWRDQPEMQKWIGTHFKVPSNDIGWMWLETAMQAMVGSTVPATWYSWIVDSLKANPTRMAKILESVGLDSENQTELVDQITKFISATDDSQVRQQLLLALPARYAIQDDTLANQCLDAILADPADTTAWKSLQRLRLSILAVEQLIERLDRFSTTQLSQAITLVASAGHDELDARMLTKLAELPAAKGLPLGSLNNYYRDRSKSLRQHAQEVSQQLDRTDADTQQQVQKILSELPSGDPVRGLTLFHSAKAGCGACHQMGYVGGKIGPELSSIGRSRTREALVEAVLFPSRRIEQGYQSTSVLTTDGRLLNGIVRGKSPEGNLELQISADQIQAIAADEIEQQKPSEVSIMPGGLKELLTPQELADLISLLEAAQ